MVNRSFDRSTSMVRRGFSMRHAFKVLLAVTFTATAVNGEQSWTVSNARFKIDVHPAASGQVSIGTVSGRSARGSNFSSAEFLVVDEQVLSVEAREAGVELPAAQVIRLTEGVVISTGRTSITVNELILYSGDERDAFAGSTVAASTALELRGSRVRIDRLAGEVIVPAYSVTISTGLAAALGDMDLAGVSVGTGVLRGSVVWSGGDALARLITPSSSATAGPIGNTAMGTTAPDVTFCELYGLQQFGRLFDTVGLAVNTTSWNIGNADLTWLAPPDPRHPFIVQNLYRIKDDRFEQIGQSWIKHGFFALASTQCVTPCTFEPIQGHGEGPFLGMGCTDTYTSGLNAFQTGLGPREEVNPWTASWDASTSEMDRNHGHDPIEHRLQVRDVDLDPLENAFSEYIVEGYYVHFEDVLPLNNAAWKRITSITGSVGGTWNFAMAPLGADMEIGFAIDAWTGAEATILAQEIPVVKGVSPDGRCDLRAKATSNGDGTWHYEYAILNIDMDRKGGSFTVPVDPTNVITNIGFLAVRSADESFDNVPWTSSISTDCPTSARCIKWETVNNPLRWGTVYNFRFDADASPQLGAGGDPRGVTVELGLFDAGAVTSVSGPSVGPASGSFVIVSPMESAAPDAAGSQFSKSRFISFSVPTTDAGSETALGVELTSLHHPLLPADAQDFSAFEGQVRYVNLYRDSGTGDPILDCEDSAALGTTFKCATLGCAPEYADWAGLFGGGVLHVTGAGIVPSSTYNVSTLSVICTGQEATCASVSDSLPIETSIWGNVDDNPLLNVSDIVGVVDSVGQIPPAFFEPRSLLRGDVPNPLTDTQNVLDVTLSVDAVKGLAFPYAGPQVCP